MPVPDFNISLSAPPNYAVHQYPDDPLDAVADLGVVADDSDEPREAGLCRHNAAAGEFWHGRWPLSAMMHTD